MNYALTRYNEPMNETELSFLRDKESRERRQYFVVYRMLMIGCFIIPFLTSWYRAYEGAPNAFSYIRFFVTAFTLLAISTTAVYLSYRVYHRKIVLDIKDGTKTIETSHITRKLALPAHGTFHFYTDSSVKLNIEVSEQYFHSLKEGDEVSIEYTTHSRMYLGYF
jgi:hypothetical protein